MIYYVQPKDFKQLVIHASNKVLTFYKEQTLHMFNDFGRKKILKNIQNGNL